MREIRRQFDAEVVHGRRAFNLTLEVASPRGSAPLAQPRRLTITLY